MTGLFATSIIVSAVLPLILALIGGGGVAFYAAKPNKDKVVMETTEKAVTIIGATIDRQEKENAQALQRITVLEGELRKVTAEAKACLARCDEHEDRAWELNNEHEKSEQLVERLRREVIKLGGDPDVI